MQIRFLWGTDDLETAFSIRRAVFIEEQGISEELEFDAYDARAEHVVIYEGNKAVAAGRLRFCDEWAQLERICVLKLLRGYGYGRLVVMALEHLARRRGLRLLTMHAQLKAEKFYAAQGYMRVSRRFLEAGILHITMEKKLPLKERDDGD